MPNELAFNFVNLSPLINAWTAHYRAKGCTETKARDVAQRRVWRGSRTWPAGHA